MKYGFPHEKSKNAITRWHNRVIAHNKQSIDAQKHFDPDADFWEGLSRQFRDDPFRQNDPVLKRLICEFHDCETILDIGGGAGRFALPLALLKESVTVADPSPSMLNELAESSAAANIKNVRSVQTLWEEASLPIHDGILCSHVTYGIENIEDFIRKLNCHANKKIVLLSFMESPQTHLSMIWEAIHGEKRIHLPGVPELMDVLWELNFIPELSLLERRKAPVYESEQEALNNLRSSLYVDTGSEKDYMLMSSVEQHLEYEKGGLSLTGSRERVLCLINWNIN